MERQLQQIEEDMRSLAKMNKTLFDSWQDDLAKHFEQGCLGEMERQWKQFVSSVEPFIRQINKMKQDMERLQEQCKRR